MTSMTSKNNPKRWSLACLGAALLVVAGCSQGESARAAKPADPANGHADAVAAQAEGNPAVLPPDAQPQIVAAAHSGMQALNAGADEPKWLVDFPASVA